MHSENRLSSKSRNLFQNGKSALKGKETTSNIDENNKHNNRL